MQVVEPVMPVGEETESALRSRPDSPRLEAEEARPHKAVVRPDMPTQAEIDQHRVDHIPYRAWFPECVEGFGRERAHHAHGAESRSIPLISCDYMYLSSKGVFSKEELPEGETDTAVCVSS